MPRELDAQNAPIYRDTQRLSPRVYAVLIAIMGFLGYLATTLPRPGSIVLASAAALVFLVGLIIAVNFSRMMTEVSATEVRGRFGLYQFAIPLQRIVRAEVVEVSLGLPRIGGFLEPQSKADSWACGGGGGSSCASAMGSRWSWVAIVRKVSRRPSEAGSRRRICRRLQPNEALQRTRWAVH